MPTPVGSRRFRPSYRSIWGISFPIIIAGVSEAIVEITDTIFLAHYGVTELAAIGLADSLYTLAMFLSMGVVDGIQIIIGRRAGQRQAPAIGRVFNQGLYLLVLSSIGMIAFINLVVPLYLGELFASDQVYTAVHGYLRIAVYGLLFQSINLAYSAFYVGISRTRVLIGAALVLALTNITLDYALIFGRLGFVEQGIEGAAIASLIAETATFLFLTLDIIVKGYPERYGLLRLGRWNAKLNRKLLTISWPVSLDALVELGKWFVLFMIIEQLGEDVLASANIIFSCYALYMISIDSFSETVCSMVSNLLGQRRRAELYVLIRQTIKLSYLVVIPLLLLSLLFPTAVLAIFTPDETMIEASKTGLVVILLATLLAVPADTLYSAVAGTGDTRITLAIQCFTTLSVLSFAAFTALWVGLPLAIILLAEVVGWLVCLLLSWAWMRSGRWLRLEI